MDNSPGPDMDFKKTRIPKPEKQAAETVWKPSPPAEFLTGPWRRGLPSLLISLAKTTTPGFISLDLCFDFCFRWEEHSFIKLFKICFIVAFCVL